MVDSIGWSLDIFCRNTNRIVSGPGALDLEDITAVLSSEKLKNDYTFVSHFLRMKQGSAINKILTMIKSMTARHLLCVVVLVSNYLLARWLSTLLNFIQVYFNKTRYKIYILY